MGTKRFVRHGSSVAFWWFMVVSQHPGGALSAATQGPFATQAQCEWGRQQMAGATGLRGGQGVGWGSTPCWSDDGR